MNIKDAYEITKPLSAKPYIETVIERKVRVIYTVIPGIRGAVESGLQIEPDVHDQVSILRVLTPSEDGWREMETSKPELDELYDEIT